MLLWVQNLACVLMTSHSWTPLDTTSATVAAKQEEERAKQEAEEYAETRAHQPVGIDRARQATAVGDLDTPFGNDSDTEGEATPFAPPGVRVTYGSV